MFFKIINWRIIALQCCVGSAVQQSKAVIGVHTSPLSLTSLPHPTPSPQVVTEIKVELPVLYIYKLPTSHLLYMWWYVCLIVNLSVHHTLSFHCCVHRSVVYVCIHIRALQIGFSVSFFSNRHTHTHTHIYMYTYVLI